MSIRSQAVSLGRMNILIGSNGAGKSNFMSAFQLAKAISEGVLDVWVEENGEANRILYGGRKRTAGIRLSFVFTNPECEDIAIDLIEKDDRLPTKKKHFTGITEVQDFRQSVKQSEMGFTPGRSSWQTGECCSISDPYEAGVNVSPRIT